MAPEYPAWDEVYAECPSCGERINAVADIEKLQEVVPLPRVSQGLAPAPEVTLGRPTSSGGLAPPTDSTLPSDKVFYRCPKPDCRMLFGIDSLDFNYPEPEPKNMTRKPSW